ncbi:peptide chain release factor N(5)-glutamine methyltransferase [Muriicola marianensis]|uniref:peptide chain release factor N(5)-glutamine methyltransferase n=1 Tax=Muriicola marianensis TaxID=1324801 RepID=A0ABQ1QMU4_9FLAO|nr:peptide chain release factor N(5)-glutamine methyltransferase [Muriicola marianensis]GGD37196.1 release factor glutamine methyltransferase [Muriicola marianensis]
MLLKEIRHIFHKELDHQYGREEVEHFFHHFVEHYLGQPRFHLAMHPNWIISKEEEGEFFRGLAALRQGQPLHYVLGSKVFMDLNFRLNKHVLIPRPETEELVRLVIANHKEDHPPVRIMDLGTGSGCIAVSLAKYIPQAEVHAIDISGKALRLARENASANGVSVQFSESDMTKMDIEPGFYQIIVSNPPYVLEEEKNQMEPHVKDAEPATALFVPDDRPLLFYEYIAKAGRKGLADGGYLYLEINRRFGQEVKELLSEVGFKDVEVIKDLHGHDRFVKAKQRI